MLKIRSFPKPYPMEWICLIIGGFLSFYYSWILDDAYVYFRYAENLLVLRNGLVFNNGEFVEGFSSPAWMLLLVVLRVLHLNYWVIIRLVALFAFLIFWALLIILNRKLSQNQSQPYIINYPLIHLSLTYGVLSYFSSGMETPLVLVISVSYACFFLFPGSRFLQVLIGFSPLIRPELAAPYAIVFIWFLISQKKFPSILFAACFLSLGGWLFFRVYYYADFLPNTFYLKDEVAVLQGLYYLYDTLLPYFTGHIMLIFLICYIFLVRNEKQHRHYAYQRAMMLIVAASVAVYVVKIGGDQRHFRYLAFPYCIAMASTGGLIERFFERLQLQNHRRTVIGISLVIALFTLTCYPRQLIHHPVFRDKSFSHTPTPIYNIGDSARHRLIISKTPRLLSDGAEHELRPKMKLYMKKRAFHPSNNVVRTYGCAKAYHMFDHRIIHNLGLTEPFLARIVMASDFAGHKLGLMPLAKDILEIRKKYGFQKGAFQQAVEAGEAPNWVVDNLDKISIIEHKVYNTHNLWENFLLALKHVGKIVP